MRHKQGQADHGVGDMLWAGGWLDGRRGVEGGKTRGRLLWSALLGLLPEYYHEEEG